MDQVLNLSPVQTLMLLGLNAWIFIIFPIIVIKKLNRMTEILESQEMIEEDDE